MEAELSADASCVRIASAAAEAAITDLQKLRRVNCINSYSQGNLVVFILIFNEDIKGQYPRCMNRVTMLNIPHDPALFPSCHGRHLAAAEPLPYLV
jgi:hypothetical protein